MQAGLDCSHLTGDAVDSLSFAESLDFLQPQPERTCAPAAVPGVCADNATGTPVVIPGRAGAICFSADDARAVFTELATMCRAMGKRCTYQTQAVLARLRARLQ